MLRAKNLHPRNNSHAKMWVASTHVCFHDARSTQKTIAMVQRRIAAMLVATNTQPIMSCNIVHELIPAGVVSAAAAAFHAIRMEPSFAVKSTVVGIYGECRVLLKWK
jgi:hypothetical protein